MTEQKPWYRKQLRMVQTVLREPDIVGYNAEEVADYLESVNANVYIINGGGIVDFFRHDLPTANPNPFMTNEDILKDITEACHRRGIKVIVRVDFRGVDKRIYDLYPDWFSVDEHGNPRFWADLPNIQYPLYAPCYLSYYRNGHAFAFTDKLFQTYDIDGIWENSPFQSGICYCETCQSAYLTDLGKTLPRGGNYYDQTYDEYREWKTKNLNQHLADYRQTVKKYGDDKIYCAEIFGLFYDNYKSTGSDLYQVKDHFDFLVTPLFTANHEPLNAPATLMKFLQGLEPDKTPVMLFGHLGTNNQLRYVSSSATETRIWMWQAVSTGGSLWNCTFNGHHPGDTFDRRNAQLTSDIYGFMAKHEEILNDQRPVADVAIYYSRNSNNIFNSADRQKDAYITHLIGLEQVLIAERIQYSFLLDENISEQSLSEVKVLIIPNGACLSDEEIRLIDNYVKQGGRVIATNETSLYDADGTQRNDLGLSDVFGCTFTGIKKDCSQYGYQYIQGEHALTKGFEETSLIANWGINLLVKPLEGAETPITYVPQIYPQSPERAWPRSFETQFPTCVVNNYGKGRSIYFPYGVDKQVWMHGHQDFSTVLANALHDLLDGEQVLKSNAPASVQFQFNKVHEDDYIIHAINTTSAPTRPVQSVIPIPSLEIEIVVELEHDIVIESLYDDGEVSLITDTLLDDHRRLLKIKINQLNEYASLLIKSK